MHAHVKNEEYENEASSLSLLILHISEECFALTLSIPTCIIKYDINNNVSNP